MNPYLTAIQALENCVKDAMENNIDASTQSEIWRHYQGIKAIAKQLDKDKVRFNIDTDNLCTDTVTFDPSTFAAAAPVNLSFNTSPDTITFT
tara:strand:+ start:1268 stop:1543 length:276 start_codon:yes stop_codon:yes gene_type:complete